MKKVSVSTKGIAVSAIFGALGFVLMALEFPLPFIIPGFIKFDFSELPALICAFCFGPLYGVLACFIKNLLHCFISNSACVGEIANFLLGSVFVFTAGVVYKRNKKKSVAFIGSVIAAAVMAIISVPINYFLVYPCYTVLFGMPYEAIIAAYRVILPSADTLLKCLLIFNLPFTFIKGMADALICLLIYKKISPILKK